MGSLDLPGFLAECPTLYAVDVFLAWCVGSHPPPRARWIEAQLRPLQNGLDAEWARVRRELKREQVGRNKAKHLHAQLLPETYRPVTP